MFYNYYKYIISIHKYLNVDYEQMNKEMIK